MKISTKQCPRCLGVGDVPADPTDLREARRAAGLTQQALAALLNLSQAYVSDAERGRAAVTPERAGQWFLACGIETPWRAYPDKEER